MVAYLYRHYDRNGILLYVGVSLSTLNRLKQHEDNAHWFNDIVDIKIERCDSRQRALELERTAINKENPLHNRKRPALNIVSVSNHQENGRVESADELIKRIVN